MKPTPLRWTLNQIGAEFGVDRHAVATRMQTAGIMPGQDGRYYTRDATTAVFGNLHGERLRKAKAEADLLELKVAEERKRSVPNEVLFPEIERCFGAVAAVIKQARLPAADRDAILTELRGVPAALWEKGYKPADPETIEPS